MDFPSNVADYEDVYGFFFPTKPLLLGIVSCKSYLCAKWYSDIFCDIVVPPVTEKPASSEAQSVTSKDTSVLFLRIWFEVSSSSVSS